MLMFFFEFHDHEFGILVIFCGFFLIQKRLSIIGICTLLDLCCVIAHAAECSLQLTCTLECKYVTPRLDITILVNVTTICSPQDRFGSFLSLLLDCFGENCFGTIAKESCLLWLIRLCVRLVLLQYSSMGSPSDVLSRP